MMWGYGFGWGWFMMAFGGILWIAVLAILVWVLIRWFEKRERTVAPTSQGRLSALDILKERYARGELDDATFEQMRERLQASEPVLAADQVMPENRRRAF